MGLLSEFRTSLENPQTPLSYPAEWLLDIFNGGRTDSGMRVSELTALQVTTVWVCCEIKGGALGALDLKIFEKIINADGRLQRRIAHEHDFWELLADEPNPEMSSFSFRKTLQVHRMLWGYCGAEIQRDGANRPVAFWPRNPARFKPRRADKNFLIGDELVRAGELFYATTEGVETMSLDPENPITDGYTSERAISAADMIYIPGLSLDGRVGQNVIQMGRQAVGLALATEKFGSKFFGNGAHGQGIFKFPTMLSPEDFERTRRSLQEAYGGENVMRPIMLEAGADYVASSVDPDKAQAIQTREHQIAEVCRLFNVPPHMAGVEAKQARANTEQIGQEFVTFSLAADLKAWEQEFKRKLFPSPTVGRNAGRKFGVFFDTWPLTMPAANDLRQFLASMIQFGVFEPNDARERLRMNPLEGEGSDSTWMPINMAPSDKAYENPALPSAEPDGDEGSGDDGKKKKQPKKAKGVGGVQQAYSRLFRDAFGRVCARSECDLLTFQRAFLPVLLSLGEVLEPLAAAHLHADPDPDGLERSSFLAEYLKTMHHRYRSGSWSHANGGAAEICDRELNRAAKALSIEIYRQAATRAAMAATEIPEEVQS